MSHTPNPLLIDREIALLESWWDLQFDTDNGHYPPTREHADEPLTYRWRVKIDNVLRANYSRDELAEFRRIRREWQESVD